MDCRAYFNSLASNWDATTVQRPALLRSVAFLAGARPGARMLDIACGTGVTFPYLLEGGVCTLLGIDLAEAMVQLAAQKFRDDPRVTLQAIDLFHLEAPPFDGALLYNAYPHFPDKPALLAKTASLLKPGGRFTLAHGMGRAALNAHHSHVPAGLSTPLGPAAEEAALWAPAFRVDCIIDREDFYLISGVCR